MSKAIVLWTHIPSHHTIGPFRELAKTRKVYCVCREPMSKFRKDIWNMPELGDLDVTFLCEQSNVDAFMDDFLAKTKDATHFFSGFGDLPEMKALWKKAKRLKIKPIVIAERPNPQPNKFKSVLRDLYYFYKMRAWDSRYAALLCMGQIGVDAYCGYGTPERKALPYMYTNALDAPEFDSAPTVGRPLRMVYVGGSVKWRKGLDVLIAALKGCDPNKIIVDFIGPTPDSWVAEAAKEAGVDKATRFLGKIPSDKIGPMLAKDYDALFLPSRHDGWGMTPSEAILAGIGAIVTDACGCCGIVSASGAGSVVKAGDVSSLRSAIQSCVDDPNVVLRWKERARAYRDDLRPENLTKYIEGTIEYVERGCTGEKPKAYWLEPRV